MEKEHAEAEADRNFKRRRAEANAACEEQTRKRAAKRRRRKQNKRAARKRGSTGPEGHGDSRQNKTVNTVKRSVGIGQNALPNNGTALQKLLAMQSTSSAVSSGSRVDVK